MKAVILAGGFGTRLHEETTIRPKPMVEIGGRPILWHIMKIFEANGVTEFIVALGYKGEDIKDYFLHYHARNSDLTVDLDSGAVTLHHRERTRWKVHLVDTGLNTMTGGRLLRLREWLTPGETFFFTYGDGLADIDLQDLLRFHRAHGRLATVTTVRPPSRFGSLAFDEAARVTDFYEKSTEGATWINGGFFALEPAALDYVDGDDTVWEKAPVERLAVAGQLMGYKHAGFWSCMDTLKEKQMLEAEWSSGRAPWRIWGLPGGWRSVASPGKDHPAPPVARAEARGD
jgi:glucose-1-phosphate cytidylyltransferase